VRTYTPEMKAPLSAMQFRSIRFAFFLLFGVPVFAASVPGIRNFDQVDQNVYRGGQPTTRGFRNLASLGVKTVIDLRESGARSQTEQRIVTAAGMNYLNIPMSGLTPPTAADITKILDLLEHPSAGPAFVHCLHGADRTGAVIAAYRIDHDHWDNARALSDAKAHSMSSFQWPRQNFIRQFQARNASPANGIALPAAAIVPGGLY
jgi:tyrosine-protein phosphatase SIW14